MRTQKAYKGTKKNAHLQTFPQKNCTQVTKVFSLLRQKGIDIRGDVYTVDFALKTIKEYMGRKDGEANA